MKVDADGSFTMFQVGSLQEGPDPHREHRLVGALPSTVRLALVFDVENTVEG